MSIRGDYSTIVLDYGNANERELSPVILHAGDVTGRTIRFVMRDGTANKDATGLTARFFIDQGGGLYCDMEAVGGTDTATFEVAVPMGNVDAGHHKGCIAVSDVLGNTVCTRAFPVYVEKSMDGPSDDAEMMEVVGELRQLLEDLGDAASDVNRAAEEARAAIADALATLVPQAVEDEIADWDAQLAGSIPDSAIVAMVVEEWR